MHIQGEHGIPYRNIYKWPRGNFEHTIQEHSVEVTVLNTDHRASLNHKASAMLEGIFKYTLITSVNSQKISADVNKLVRHFLSCILCQSKLKT